MRTSLASRLIGMILAAGLAVGTATVWAADNDDAQGGYGPYYGMGPGMMGGYGGYGMGPGMMGGYGGYGMGPGMMGGYGGGYGMGPGMMGFGPLGSLDLNDEQRAKIDKIIETERKQHWSTMGKMLDVQNKLRYLYAADEPDPKKVGAVYGELAKLQQQMLETHVRASNQVHQVLTKEQREQLRQWNRGGWGPGWGPRRGPSGRNGTMGPGGTPGSMMGR